MNYGVRSSKQHLIKMKNWAFLLLVTIFSCNNQEQNVDKSESSIILTPKTSARVKISSDEICWVGTLNGKTPVFIHYQLDSNLIIGEITYLNTKDKLPIRLLGTIENDKSFRLLEFDKMGNITGIIEGTPTEKNFNGIWVSPKTNKELGMTLSSKDTIIGKPSVGPDKNQIFGEYHYQYGEDGYRGDFDISKIENNKIDFSILSLTNIERGPNIAQVEKDTIAMVGNSFVYKIPDSDSCEFKVTFYKGFVYINYTRGYCESQFGLNASIDGIYLKTK
jgi:hypothetical protein